MDERDERETLCSRLPVQLAAALRALDPDEACMLEEVRVYAGGQVQLVIGGRSRMLPVRANLDDLLLSLSAHALYSCETQMAEGYIPLPGGHRAGVCGRMRQQDGMWRMTDVLSVCIRICRRIPDASRGIRPFLLDEAGMPCRVLLLGAPGCGKTTVLRDAALWLAQQGLHVGVADEREELFATKNMDALPPGLDVLCGLDKARTFSMLVRSMAPQVIVSDEIGHPADAQAVLDAVRCGVGLLLSAHAGSMADAMRRPALCQIIKEHAFDRCILLGRYGGVSGVYDGQGRKEAEWEERAFGQLGCGRDGDDRHQRGRLSACGW